MGVWVLSHFSLVQLFVTLWTVALWPPLFMGILQARILEWFAISPFRDLSDPGIKPRAPTAPSLQADSLPLSHQGSLSYGSVQFSSVAQLSLTLCDPMDCSTPGFPVHHHLPELAQTHVQQVGDTIQPSHPLLFPSSVFNLSQHQGLFQWVSSSHQVAEVLELQLQHQSFQWIFRTDVL